MGTVTIWRGFSSTQGGMEQWDPSTGRVPGQGVESSLTGKKKEFSSIAFHDLRVKVLQVSKNISENRYLS